MAVFLHTHMAELYVLYGLAFFLLAVALFLQPRDSDPLGLGRNLHLLALFGLLHGLKEYSALWLLLHGTPAWLWPDGLLLLVSYLPLLEFGRRVARKAFGHPLPRRLLGPGIHLPLAAGLLALMAAADQPLDGLNLGARYLFGLPGGLLAGMGLLVHLHQRRELLADRRLRFHLGLAAVALAAYGALTGVGLASPPGLPAFLDSTALYAAASSLPVEFWRMLCAGAMALGLTLVIRQLNEQSRLNEQRALALVQTLNTGLEERIRQRTAELEASNRTLIDEIEMRRHTEQALTDTQVNLKQAQAVAGVGSWHLDVEDSRLEWTDETYRIFGVPRDQALDYEFFLSRVHADDRQAVDSAWQAAVKGARYDIEHRIVVDGEVRWVRERAELEREPEGRLRRAIGTVQDITERKRSQQALEDLVRQLQTSARRQAELLTLAQQEQGRMAALLSAMSIGILFEDRHGRVEYINPAFRHMWAIPEDAELVGRPTRDVLEHSTNRFARPDHASKHVLHVLDTHEISERFELTLYDGRILTQISYPVHDAEGRALGRLWIYEDITHERQTAQQLIYLAERDPLTGLYNRHRFQDHLEQMIQTAGDRGTRFALLYFDLDEFKYINDTFGHRAGDMVLLRTAGEISGVVRSGEVFARLGGDEFAILTGPNDADQAEGLAERVVEAVSAIPFRFRGSNLRLTVSVGIALFPEHGEVTEDLVAHADTAMYQAKNMGKNTWAVYDPNRDPSEAMMERLTWNRRIGLALEQDLFELHYQGVYRTGDRGLNHLEALVRMRDPADPDLLIMPGQFIPIAEKSGQIVEIDRWVLRRSITLLADRPDLPGVAVNVSGRTFDDPTLARYIGDLLKAHAVDPGRLVIELTETAAVAEIQDAQRFIEDLHHLGCSVCLDDFGSGFATFSYLKHLGVEVLKIDGMFIRDLPNNPDNQAFVKAMVDVARGLHKRTVAEFVEDQATLDMLQSLGVDLAQGYHLDRPSADHPALAEDPARSAGVSMPGSE